MIYCSQKVNISEVYKKKFEREFNKSFNYIEIKFTNNSMSTMKKNYRN